MPCVLCKRRRGEESQGVMSRRENESRDAADDVAWFGERMALLVEELRKTKSPRRAAHLRMCLENAMEVHGEVVRTAVEPSGKADF